MSAQTFAMADLIDAIAAVIDTARAKVAGTSWANALEDGYNMLLQMDTIVYAVERHELTVESSQGGVFYHANGVCECKAGQKDIPCWHRAAAKLVRRALEYQAAAQAAQEEAERAATARQIAATLRTFRRNRMAAAQAAVDELFA